MTSKVFRKVTFAFIGVSVLALSACSESEAVYPTRDRYSTAPRTGNEKRETIFGPEGLFGNHRKDEGGGSIGVNSFLWRASLDTVGFMPFAGTPDPFGGTIVTDWYTPPETPSERFKINVLIIDRALRADGVKVTVFKQVRNKGGQWVESSIDPRTAAELENTILTRARQLRIVSTE